MGLISSEQYAIAEANGIGKRTVESRVYLYDWSVERAITEKIKQHKDIWGKWESVSKVKKTAFYVRMSRGMTAEEAALTPPGRRKKARVTKEHEKIAESNGIAKGTLHARVYQFNWDIEKAITTPPKANGRRGKWNEVISTRSKRQLQRG